MTGAAVIRLLGVTTRGIQYDDAFSILLAGRSIPEIISGTAADTMPPLYYLILHYWQMAGRSVPFLRLPGILFSLGIVFLTYIMVEKAVNREAAVWSASILAVSPLQFYHAQDIRMYSLATLLILGWNWGALEVNRIDHPRELPVWKWICLVLCGTGALYSHALAGFGLLAPYVYFVWKRKCKHLVWMGAAGAVTLGLYLPWLAMVPGQIAKVQKAFWTPVPGIVEILQAVIMAFGDIPAPPIILGIVLFAAICVTVLSTICLFRNRGNNGGLLFFTLMMLMPPVCLYSLSYLMRPMFVPRAFLSAYVGLAAVLGILLSRSRAVEKYIIGGLIALCAICTLPYSISFDRFPRSDFKNATQFLEQTVGPRGIILHDNKLSYFPSKVYKPGLDSRFLADEPGSANDTLALTTMKAMNIEAYTNIEDAVRGYERVFFVVFAQTIEEYSFAGGHPVILFLSNKAGDPVKHEFGDLLILEYAPVK